MNYTSGLDKKISFSYFSVCLPACAGAAGRIGLFIEVMCIKYWLLIFSLAVGRDGHQYFRNRSHVKY